MSLKRYAIISALHHRHHRSSNNNRSTTTTTPLIINKNWTLVQLQPRDTLPPTSPAATTSARSPTPTTTIPAHSYIAPNGVGDRDGGGRDNGSGSGSDSDSDSEEAFTTYYGGGLGLFHQQNIRAHGGGGIALMAGSSFGGGHSFPNTINGNVNLLLGGAMLSLIITILCIVCYCCHRNIKKRTEAAYRQQRQWMETDPNMEIYSVEQCYEASGLFLGESTDGLTALPALHHEPPPSYDAVVAMQEQQQLLRQHQQILLQQQQQQQQQQQVQLQIHNSPPPGYRSTLEVNAICMASATSLGAAVCSHGAADGKATGDCNGNHGQQLSRKQQLASDKSLVAAGIVGAVGVGGGGGVGAGGGAGGSGRGAFNMKTVLNAQSCCSLQRAEVENLWNAAAAAIAARSARTATTAAAGDRTSSLANSSNATTTTTGRRTSYFEPTAPTVPETFGQRYLQQNYYRRGCPLCGKFRYDTGSTLSLSAESDLDILPLREEYNVAGVQTNQEDAENANDCTNCCSPHGGRAAHLEQDDEDEEECSCGNEANNPVTGNRTPTIDADNGNNVSEDLHSTHSRIHLTAQDADSNSEISVNSNEFEYYVPETTTSPAVTVLDANANSTPPTTPTVEPTRMTEALPASSPSSDSATVALDSINDNEVIGLDLSQ